MVGIEGCRAVLVAPPKIQAFSLILFWRAMQDKMQTPMFLK
jgi:hypothetical protein